MRGRLRGPRMISLVLGVVAALAAATLAAPLATAEESAGAEQLRMLQEYWQAEASGPSTASRSLLSLGERELLASATADECYDGVGPPYPAPTGADEDGVTCDPPAVPKTNQAYVWGLTQANDRYFFGTAANVLCLVLGGFLGATSPVETDSWVCEFGQSRVSQPPLNVPAIVGDWRPPHLYMYDDATDTLEELSVPGTMPAGALGLLNGTLGIRSAGSARGVVLFAGPGLVGGINVFAFDDEGSFLAAENVPAYTNIRKWITVGNQLVTGVKVGSDSSGRLLRWTGDAADPVQFEEVGQTPSEVAELASYKGRIAVTTWPSITSVGQGGTPVPAGLFVTPPIGRLTNAPLEQLWSATDYEPDPVVAVTYGGGALQQLDGDLYWGTMHVPGVAAAAHTIAYGEAASTQEALLRFLGTHRAISIFKLGPNLKSPVEVVYGQKRLPVFDGATSSWSLEPNGIGTPTQGLSGFGNPFNNYTWIMAKTDRLFVGTMDWSYLLASGLDAALGDTLPPGVDLTLPRQTYGADLWQIWPGTGGRAVPLSTDGVGNYLNYGLRTVLVEDDSLVLGTANPMNLEVVGEPDGGWELLRYTPPGA